VTTSLPNWDTRQREEEDIDLLGSLGTQSFQCVSLLSYFLRVDSWASITLIGTDAAILVGRVRVAKEVGGVGLVEGIVNSWT
jgi:hypothetical protein